MRRTALATAVLLGLAMPTLAQDQAGRLPDGTMLRADDLQRLSGLDAAYGAALREALAGGTAEDIQAVIAALSGAPAPAATAADWLAGEWSCQKIKLGKTTPMVVYQPFTCRIGADGMLEKLTGSQRTKGRIQAWNGQLLYAGVGFIAGDTPPDYARMPAEADPQSDPQRVPEVGVVEMVSKDRGRIILPSPYLESLMDVLVLRRR